MKQKQKRVPVQRKRLKIQAICDIILCIQNGNTAKGYRIIIFSNL